MVLDKGPYCVAMFAFGGVVQTRYHTLNDNSTVTCPISWALTDMVYGYPTVAWTYSQLLFEFIFPRNMVSLLVCFAENVREHLERLLKC